MMEFLTFMGVKPNKCGLKKTVNSEEVLYAEVFMKRT